MTILRSVTGKSPSSIQVLEDSGLPFGFTLSPFGSRSELTDEKDSTFPSASNVFVQCTHCGCHLNPYSPYMNSKSVLCNLCGTIYSTDFESQYFDTKERQPVEFASFRGEERKRLERDFYAHSTERECSNTIHEQSLPCMTVMDRNTKQMQEIYALPCDLCPPLLAIFIDGSSTDKQYYKYISSCLNKLIQNESKHGRFKGTRIGIFIMTNGGGLSVFDLSKIGGHLKQCWTPEIPLELNKRHPHASKVQTNTEYEVVPLSAFMNPQDVFVPLDSDVSKACVENVLREIADSRIVIEQACQRENSNINLTSVRGVSLGSSIQYFLEFMETVGYHPGEMQLQELTEKQASKIADEKFCYAGGKIMCFLADTPIEIGPIELNRGGKIGLGGFGGSCAVQGKRFHQKVHDLNPSQNQGVNEKDIEAGVVREMSNGTSTSSNSSSWKDDQLPSTLYKDVDEFYSFLGTSCGYDAFSVELFGLTKEENTEDKEQYFGMPLLRLLSDRSGGCGPLIVMYNTDLNDSLLMKELIARSPWSSPLAFGGILRMRLPSSLQIYDSSSQKRRMKISNLSEFYEGKMHGSIATHNSDNEVYVLGTCDKSNTIAFELDICSKSGRLDESIFVDGRGDMILSPSIQSCFAYTSIVECCGRWVTVRRLRVLTEDLDITDNVESIMSSLDPEVLAVNLYHSFYEHGLQNGLASIEKLATDWLVSALLCCYKSAESEDIMQRKFGIRSKNRLSSERLLSSSNRHLSNEEILLAQGHNDFQILPLLVFCLIQCDALRPSQGSYCPSYDSRAAAVSSMRIMSPGCLSRCIAPRLDVWYDINSVNGEESTYESVNMSMIDLRQTIDDSKYNGSVPFLLIDCSWFVGVLNCHHLINSESSSASNEFVPSVLIQAAEDSKNSYRVAPTLAVDTSFIKSFLEDMMIEDSVTATRLTFNDWRRKVSEIVMEYLRD